MKTEIVLCGVGGQGLITTGEIMCLAASLFEDGLNATLTASYGAETRGTFTKTDIIISDEQIGYPYVDIPDSILCLAQIAYNQYVNRFGHHTKVFYDTELVKPEDGARGEHIGFDFRAKSISLGSIQVMNTIALGAMMNRCGLLHRESVIKAFSHRFATNKKLISVNEKALDLGLAL